MKDTIKKTIFIAAVILCVSCAKGLNYDFNSGTGTGPAYPDTFFAVISDIHIYDPSLGTSGAAFEKTMSSDRKLLLDGIDLLDFAIDEIIASQVNFVLVTGDLTKDGELINHRLAAEKLKRLLDANIAVFVVPGNHDINNPDAVRYDGDKTEAVITISDKEFASIYGAFGFNSSLFRDDDSLSYVVEPVEGL